MNPVYLKCLQIHKTNGRFLYKFLAGSPGWVKIWEITWLWRHLTWSTEGLRPGNHKRGILIRNSQVQLHFFGIIAVDDVQNQWKMITASGGQNHCDLWIYLVWAYGCHLPTQKVTVKYSQPSWYDGKEKGLIAKVGTNGLPWWTCPAEGLKKKLSFRGSSFSFDILGAWFYIIALTVMKDAIIADDLCHAHFFAMQPPDKIDSGLTAWKIECMQFFPWYVCLQHLITNIP